LIDGSRACGIHAIRKEIGGLKADVGLATRTGREAVEAIVVRRRGSASLGIAARELRPCRALTCFVRPCVTCSRNRVSRSAWTGWLS